MNRQIQVKVLFFGATAEITKTREIDIEIPANMKAGELLNQITCKFPSLKNYSLLMAVNQEYANAEKILEDRDEIAIFTPVSGG
ncbi:MAG: molybdopterin converting factor subunit 1 [Acidobacteria bacterium]|nr:MAG: molybdopterin converting factor subunit 1 [Acidobacteriota bacterium]